MCVAVPARVVAVGDGKATLDVLGAERVAGTQLVPEVAVGDYVLTHAGLVAEVLEPDEAEARIALFEELMSLGQGPEATAADLEPNPEFEPESEPKRGPDADPTRDPEPARDPDPDLDLDAEPADEPEPKADR